MYNHKNFAVTLKCSPGQPAQEPDVCTAQGKRDVNAAPASAPMDTVMLISGLLILAAALIALVLLRRQMSTRK